MHMKPFDNPFHCDTLVLLAPFVVWAYKPFNSRSILNLFQVRTFILELFLLEASM